MPPDERPVAMPDQVAKIAENMTDRYQLMVLLAAYCSLRFGELAGLRRSLIDILHRTIRIEESAIETRHRSTIFGEPKTAAGRRVVAFPAELVPMIEAHLAKHVQAAPDSLVFTSREGLLLRRTKFRPYWAEACEKPASPDSISTTYAAAERPGQPERAETLPLAPSSGAPSDPPAIGTCRTDVIPEQRTSAARSLAIPETIIPPAAAVPPTPATLSVSGDDHNTHLTPVSRLNRELSPPA